MAITEISNSYNTYANSYTNNVQKNSGTEVTEKQRTDKTESSKNGRTRKTAADELAYLSEKFDGYSFVSKNYTQGMRYGTSSTTNVAISPQFLAKMANDPELEAEYMKEIGNMQELDRQFISEQAAKGWKVERGWAIDKDGGISCWAIGRKDPKAKSFLQKMSEKSDEIRQKQLEKAKAEKKASDDNKTSNISGKNSVSAFDIRV